MEKKSFELNSQYDELKSFLQNSQDREAILVNQLGEYRKKVEIHSEDLERTKMELLKEIDRVKELQKLNSDLEVRSSAQVVICIKSFRNKICT